MSVGEKAVVTDADEALGEDMEKKAADELQRLEDHGGLLVSLSVVFPAKGDTAVVEREQPLVGDGDPVGVAGEVLEHLLGAAEGRLGVDHPVFGVEVFSPAFPAGAWSQGLELAMEGEFSLVESLLEVAEELASKEATQDADGEKEVGAGDDPASGIERQPATRDHCVNMRVVVEVLAPGMQDNEESDAGPQMLRISGEGEEALGGGAEKDPVHAARVL